jgi:GNAT superfamily N-acetyltransferase
MGSRFSKKTFINFISSMNIRKAKIEDAVSLARISIDTWRATYADILTRNFLDSLSIEHRTERWRDRLSNPDKSRFTLVAEDNDGKIMGYAGGQPERDGNPVYTGEVGDIYVLPSFQRQGIGSRFIASVVFSLKQQGHKAIMLWAFTANPYRKFYEDIGGQVIGEKINEIDGVKVSDTAYGWQDLCIFEQILKHGKTS